MIAPRRLRNVASRPSRKGNPLRRGLTITSATRWGLAVTAQAVLRPVRDRSSDLMVSRPVDRCRGGTAPVGRRADRCHGRSAISGGRYRRRMNPEKARRRTSPSHAGGVRLLDDSDWAWRQDRPAGHVLQAFGVRENGLRRLPGGSGHVWTDGRLVLKPVGCEPEHAWVCEVYAAWKSEDVRVPAPVAPRGEDAAGWSVNGWGAHVFLPGRDTDLRRELARVKEASDAFHHSVESLPRPLFMDLRDDPWAFGDRLAWEATEPEGDAQTLEVIEQLRAKLTPVRSPEQVIHGDILPNVLVADGLPPAIIDWPPYFRPVGMANAVAVTDAVTFQQAPMSLIDVWETGQDWNQVLVRALLYRLGPTGIFAARDRLMGSLVTHVERVRPVVDAVLSRC